MEIVSNVITNGIRLLAFTFDSVAYTLIGYCYQIILYLSNIDLSNFGGVSSLINRIYILLGIFMLFKLAFSIIQYVVAPDSFTDSGKGFGKLATNVMISMALLVATPWMFNMLYEVQGYVLKSNIVGRLVMGSTIASSDSISSDKIKSMALDTEFLLYGGFASLNTDVITECEGASIMGTTEQVTVNDGACIEALKTKFESELLKSSDITLYDFFKYKENGVIEDKRDFGAFSNIITWQEDSKYMINYIPFISTLVGGYVAFLLISYCVDIALRAVKLLFLQMVAPISIISYIDPKESISNSKLINWLKEVFTTWASLFVRLLVIFLVIQLISIIATGVFGEGLSGVSTGNLGTPDGVTQMFIYVFLVIGCFQFAKKAPELVEKLFGFKMSGELNLNPMKNDGFNSLVGGAVGAGVGGISSGIAKASYAGINGKNRLGAFATGFAQGTIGGAYSGRKWDGKDISSLTKAPLGVSGNVARYYGAKQGTSFHSRASAMFADLIGGVQPADAIKNRIDAGKRYSEMAESFSNDLVSKANKMNAGKFGAYDASTGIWNNAADRNTWERIEQYKNLKEQYDAAKQRGDLNVINAIKEGHHTGTYRRADGSIGNFDNLRGTRFDDVEDNIKEEMYRLVNNHRITRDDDVQRLENKRATLERIASENTNAREFASINKNTFDTVSNINDSRKSVQTATQITENDPYYEDTKQSKDAIKDNHAYQHFKNH